MNTEMIPPENADTDRPEPGEDFKYHSTLPPFASDERVDKLEKKLKELESLAGAIKSLVGTLTDKVTEFGEEVRALVDRQNRIAGRVAALDGREERNGKDATG